jgi:hypothetical protein
MDVPQLVPMDDGRNGLCNFPTATDVLAEILVRLPPNVRRRLRLVCQLDFFTNIHLCRILLSKMTYS